MGNALNFADIEELAVQIIRPGRIAADVRSGFAAANGPSGFPRRRSTSVRAVLRSWGASRSGTAAFVTTRAGDAQWQEPHRYCRRCRRSFSLSPENAWGLTKVRTRQAVLERLIYAGVHHHSFERASATLQHLADLSIPTTTSRTPDAAHRYGTPRRTGRGSRRLSGVAAGGALQVGAGGRELKPDLAVVEVDGGRLQVLDRVAADAVPAAKQPRPPDIGVKTKSVCWQR